MEDAWDRGFWASGEIVCSTHVSEPFLASFSHTGDTETCAACGLVPEVAIELDDLMDALFATVRCYWGRALDDLFYDRESEHGFAFPGDVLTTDELVSDNFYGFLDDPLIEVANRLWADHEQWYDRSSLWFEGEELLSYSWSVFADWARAAGDGQQSPEPDHLWIGEHADGIPPSAMLPRLANLAVDLGLIREVDVVWYRARHLDPGETPNAETLGSVPSDMSRRPNRFLAFQRGVMVASRSQLGLPA